MLFFDGVNEEEFAAATLYFEGFVDYELALEKIKNLLLRFRTDNKFARNKR